MKPYTKQVIILSIVFMLVFAAIIFLGASLLKKDSASEAYSPQNVAIPTQAPIHLQQVFVDMNGDGRVDYVESADVIFNYTDTSAFQGQQPVP